MKYKNTKQIHQIYFYLYIIKHINSQLQTINSNIYTYDSVGNKLTKQDPSGTHNYTYDNTYQLTQATHPSIPTEAFTYDAVGNRTNTTVDAANKLLQDSNASYQYDNNGNRYIKTQSDGSIVYYSYDYEGRLTRVESQKPGLTSVAVYKYDALGRRIEKNVDGVVTRYLYSNEGLIAEYDANNNLKKSYGWLPNGIWGTDPLYMTENNQTYFYHNDALGTPQKMTDANGTVVWSANYTAFGEATVDASSTITSNLRFAGQYFDQETGINYNLFRVYDPKTGTYISKDPIGFAGGDVNLYRYVGNNPVRFVDPLGLIDLFIGVEGDLVGISGIEFGGGIVIDTVHLLDSGLFGTIGIAFGANVGVAVMGGGCREIQGDTANVDINLGKVSPSASFDKEGFNGFSIGVGPGVGLSVSATKTGALTVRDVVKWVKGWFK